MSGGASKIGDWDKASRTLVGMSGRVQKALIKGLGRAGQRMRTEIRKGIKAGAPGGNALEPLTAFTIHRKGSSKPLIDNSDLLDSITYEVDKQQLAVFIGVLRSAQNRDGESLVDLALVHEEGAVIPVTPKMRGYFMWAFGIRLKPSTQFITIPARPFLRPSFQAHARRVGNVVLDEVRTSLEGGW